ncbi:nucleotide exchange factor GrpE [Nonomuraea sp. PA05]|uniref:nucleotide exchange factor GrpE n=1 Tax=Nonomuraea sp. PA05 TaxID=2604466 RepID=UPI0011D47B8F|nr:nucleotide exchange factor GrpE [Nonomuraea sp. PA05]TYB66623.1 nucleotide exchange factor GrpE [Nonomuraea sp. PA05]
MVSDEVATTAPDEAEAGGEQAQASEQPGLDERMAAIESAVAEFNRRSAHREAVIDRLHEENQVLRGGLHRTILEPVVTDLIRMYDSLLRESARLSGEHADPACGRLLESFADDTLLLLERCGLEEFTARPGDRFDAGRHTAVSVVPAPDETADNTVAEVMAIGFVERETGRVRRPVRASFHQYRRTQSAEHVGPGKHVGPAEHVESGETAQPTETVQAAETVQPAEAVRQQEPEAGAAPIPDMT